MWSLIFIFPIKLYQLFISPMLPNTCRHLPTCSDYTIEAIQEFGVSAFHTGMERKNTTAMLLHVTMIKSRQNKNKSSKPDFNKLKNL